jgi:glycosyltransferase involved in cell wall biosynthesis
MSRNENLTLACVTKPHLDRLQVLLPKVLPFVDRAVIVIGERHEKTENYLKSLGEKVEIYYYKWRDNFAASWNAYLQQIQDGWILVVDDDEVPSDPMLESLDDYINNSNHGEKYCCVGFRCNPISEGQDMGPCNYYRQIFFRRAPGMKYISADPESGSHQCLINYQNNRIIHSKDHEVYYHIKSLEDEYRNASRNYWTYGIWRSDQDIQRREEWHELHSIVKEVYSQVQTFPDLDRLLVVGNIHSKLKDWMVKWWNNLQEGSDYFREHPDYLFSDYNEVRALPQYYFKFLHPEEKPEGMEV